jgi:hypothetical protein
MLNISKTFKEITKEDLMRLLPIICIQIWTLKKIFEIWLRYYFLFNDMGSLQLLTEEKTQYEQ